MDESLRIGIDLGGTKIEGVVLVGEGEVRLRRRVPTPQGDYAATLDAVADLVRGLEDETGRRDMPVGIGHPGAVSPASGRIKNANSTCLNGEALQQDLEARLDRPLRLANDADCLVLSETADGAAAGAQSAFAVILGTGVGGGIAVRGQLLGGPNAIAGEWGHNPLPWAREEWGEFPGPACWCGRKGCIETWLSGPALTQDHVRRTGRASDGATIAAAAARGDEAARLSVSRYVDRLARALAHVINLLDPEVIVLGGGVSRVEALYREVSRRWGGWVFSDSVRTRLVRSRHGDSSGVFGAARLWPLESVTQVPPSDDGGEVRS